MSKIIMKDGVAAKSASTSKIIQKKRIEINPSGQQTLASVDNSMYDDILKMIISFRFAGATHGKRNL